MRAQEIQIANQANFKSNQPAKITSEQKAPEQKENGKKLLALGAAAVATITVAGIAIYKGKGKQVVQEVQEDVNKAGDNAKNVVKEAVQELSDDVTKAAEGTADTVQKLGDDASKAGEGTEFTNIIEITVKAPSEVTQEVVPEAEKAAGQVTRKLSGNAEERLADFENGKFFAEPVRNMTPEELEAFKKLKPEILEQIGDEGLVCYLVGDIEAITTTLNGISSETLKALNDIGISTDTIIAGLACAGKKPTTEDVLKAVKYWNEHQGYEFNPAKFNVDMVMPEFMREHKSQFIRVKLMDEIFTPEGIKSLNDLNKIKHYYSQNTLSTWLGGKLAKRPFCASDVRSLVNNRQLSKILKDEYKNENAILELAKKIEESL